MQSPSVHWPLPMTRNQIDPMLDVVPGVYCMFDANGRFTAWNRTYMEVFRLTPVDMARSLSLDVLAEGVETQRQLDFLHLDDCAQYQSFLFSRPFPAEQMQTWLRNHCLPDPTGRGRP